MRKSSPEFLLMVKLFEEYGAIEKHEFKGFSSRYETIREDHHHLIDILFLGYLT